MTRWGRIVLPALVALVLPVLVSVPAAPDASAQQAPRVERLSGQDRIATAVAIARATLDGTPAPTLVLARSDAFPDGLAGGPLATAREGSLVLTDADVLSPVVAAALDDLVIDGGTVVVLGGESAIAPEVVAAIERRGRRVVRIAGLTREATAVVIADDLKSVAGSPDHVFVASGAGFADALAASAVAAARAEPVLLTTTVRLHPATAAWLRDNAPERVTVVGGPVVVADEVLATIGDLGIEVARVSGPDRYATAALVADTFAPVVTSGEVVVASGISWPDALAGGPFAAMRGAPVLLTGDVLSSSTDAAVRTRAPGRATVLGGTVALPDAVLRRVDEAVMNGAGTAVLVGVDPFDGGVVTSIDAGVVLTFDAAVDTVAVDATLDGQEQDVTAVIEGATVRISFPALADKDLAGRGAAALSLNLRVGTGTGQDVAQAIAGTRHTVAVADTVFASASGIDLHELSASIDMIGFHQANHDGARPQVTNDNGTRKVVMSSRGRGTGQTSAADIVAEPGVAITSPVTGRVVRGGSYTLYCRYTDNFLVIEPDGFPGFEVKLLHFQGLTVAAGDRVEAGDTVVGSGPTQLPFRSQVDEHSATGWPHVHLEVVDTSIPDRPNSGSGSDGC